MLRVLVAIVTALAVAACVTTVPIHSVYEPGEGAFIHERGTNRIEGSAFMRQRNGGVVTCAGASVSLIPSTTYARERMVAFFGTADRKAVQFYSMFPTVPEEADATYWSDIRVATCDHEGRFIFDNVAPGTYFITVQVQWEVPSSFVPEGGLLMHPVSFSAQDETTSVVLSQ